MIHYSFIFIRQEFVLEMPLCMQIDCLCEDGRVVFVDGSGVVADAIVYCTG